MTRKEGGRKFVSIEDYVDAAQQRLEEYINQSKERLITVASDSNNNNNKKKYEDTSSAKGKCR